LFTFAYKLKKRKAMKKIFTLLFVIGSIQTFAQNGFICTFMIPMSPGHIKITSDQTINGIGIVYWICDGVNVTVASSVGSMFVLEQYATLTINDSDGDEVYAKNNCVVTNNSSADIGITLNPATVTVNNTGSGSITTTASCGAVVYNYSMVGGTSGCAPLTSVNEQFTSEFSIYPNPASQQFTIEGISNMPYYVFDLLGNIVQTGITQQKTVVNCQGMNRGVYFVKVGQTTLKLLLND